MSKRDDHSERAALLRAVLDAIPAETDASPADRVIRRRVEGAIIGEELAAGRPSPRTASDDAK